MLRLNVAMSLRFGKEVYDSENRQFPYYVREWDACVTEAELSAGRFKDDNYCPTVQRTLVPYKPTNWEMTKKYGIQVCDSLKIGCPYYVPEWNEYLETEQEISDLAKDHWMTLEIGEQ